MKVTFDEASLILFNMQLELIPLLEDSANLTHNCIWLSDLFATHDLPVALIEHEKLGKIAPPILQEVPKAKILTKHHFSIAEEPTIINYLKQLSRKQVVIAGAELHVCIYQSVVDLLALGYEVFVLADSVSARNRQDSQWALERLKKTKCELITKEMLFFELIKHSERPDYLELAMKFLDGRYIR
ncbi:isochorismatase family protein [Legionella bononiensis]|uniref:Isochorismatase family protein n=1 Tax=Legionella bononiensis TaxID=2793102 RepID=A0ABS1WE53_9GAMM|nr:isochorismatase family protein [Legionella bononiensis]MBL7479527.1 isochorismatase family protein [Legionella bononiensis]MBL7527599.1 isochorismatase family protein [Legionella bononiensis]